MVGYGILRRVQADWPMIHSGCSSACNTWYNNFSQCQRYDVGLLWADDNIQLPKIYFSSLRQLKSFKKRISQDNKLKKYFKIIGEDLEKRLAKNSSWRSLGRAVVEKRMVPTTSSRNQPKKTGESAQSTKWCSRVLWNFVEELIAHWLRLAPKLNPCTTQVSSTSICPVRRDRGYVPPSCCPWLWIALIVFFVVGGSHGNCCSASVHAQYFRG